MSLTKLNLFSFVFSLNSACHPQLDGQGISHPASFPTMGERKFEMDSLFSSYGWVAQVPQGIGTPSAEELARWCEQVSVEITPTMEKMFAQTANQMFLALSFGELCLRYGVDHIILATAFESHKLSFATALREYKPPTSPVKRDVLIVGRDPRPGEQGRSVLMPTGVMYTERYVYVQTSEGRRVRWVPAKVHTVVDLKNSVLKEIPEEEFEAIWNS